MKRTVSAAVLGAVLVGCALLGLAPPAVAQGCTAAQITVVVQYGDDIRVGCASGGPETGYEALRSAFGSDFITYARGNGAGAVCRLGGNPSTNNCGSMPPANAYWAYFTGTPGGGWKYSDLGGGSSDPSPATVEGWRFQDSDARTAPSIAPPASAAPAPSPRPTRSPSAKPTRNPGSPTSSAPAAPDASATPTTPTTTPTTTDGPTPTAAASDLPATPDATDLVGDPSADLTNGAVAQTAAADDSSGGLSWVWGLVLLGVLAAAGGGAVVVRRRG